MHMHGHIHIWAHTDVSADINWIPSISGSMATTTGLAIERPHEGAPGSSACQGEAHAASLRTCSIFAYWLAQAPRWSAHVHAVSTLFLISSLISLVAKRAPVCSCHDPLDHSHKSLRPSCFCKVAHFAWGTRKANLWRDWLTNRSSGGGRLELQKEKENRDRQQSLEVLDTVITYYTQSKTRMKSYAFAFVCAHIFAIFMLFWGLCCIATLISRTLHVRGSAMLIPINEKSNFHEHTFTSWKLFTNIQSQKQKLSTLQLVYMHTYTC